MHSDNAYMLAEGRDLLALIGHEHADAYNEIDILESLALEGFEWNGNCWCPIEETPLPRTRKPPEPIDARLRRLGAPQLPGF